MSAPDFIRNAFKATLNPLGGGETVTIASKEVEAVVSSGSEMEDLVMGGDGDMRSVTLTFVTADLPSDIPAKGGTVELRGEEWQIATVDRHPLTHTRLTLNSPSRRS